MYKKARFADNIIILFRRDIMAKRKKNKNKVVKLSDEQYSAYIMALKDETPPSLYVDAQKNNDKNNE